MQKIPVRHLKSDLNDPDINSKLNIWSLRELLGGEDMVQEIHRHSFYLMLIIDKGNGEHIIDFTSHPVSDQNIFIIRPGQVHGLKLHSRSEGYMLQLTDELCSHFDETTKHILKKISRKNFYPTDTATSQKIFSIIRTTIREIFEKREMYHYAVLSNLQLLFVELLRQKNKFEGTFDEKVSYHLEKLEQFQDLITDNIANQKQVLWYAGKMNLSTYQLNTITKITLGKSSAEVINDYILLETKRYLLATNNRVNQISWHLGYEDVSYFIRFFKKHTGFSPEAFRNNFK
ncbi:AraC-like DNA-binding protein [Mucilaginibacter sp. SG538B]|uniref:helix-turn-helix domain-containing protein n=1 Tax=Mucilaginibacter sp. SG538B TaxID=2587021 RepID=UPI00159E3447|nr:AraC family transcriptional regulator [Mucilaginibacter sp. SG538B]NVM66586.1 AraC-like DNA-binding protein [Mucilaginibacter sp. SG538B]